MSDTSDVGDTSNAIDLAHDTKQCSEHLFGYCYGNIITEKYTWQYRHYKGGHCPDEEIDVHLCKRHYEWLYLANGNKKREFIQGRDLTEAIGDDLCSVFSNYDYANKVSYVYKFWYNTETSKVILVNEHSERFDSVMISKGYEKKGMFYYNGKFVIDLSPISWEINSFEKQRQPGNQRYDYKGDNMSSIYRFVLNSEETKASKDDKKDYYNLLPFDIEVNSVLDKWIDERSTFEECLSFITDNMGLKLDKLDFHFYDEEYDKAKEDKAKNEKYFIFKNSCLLENALLINTPESSLELEKLLEKGKISLEVLWIVYVKYNHRLHAPDNEKKITENDILINLFVKFCSKDELIEFLKVAIEGCRNEVTYRQRDFYDYVHTNLYVVKHLVPKYIKHDNIIDSVQNGNYVKLHSPLDFWYHTKNFTWAVYGMGETKHYDYDKDETIHEYLESLNV